ncbi:MAG: hypothetical protein IJN77_07765, partial [Oscillospiraceae bacterium]|nr:hypothetical protein [Oscillospiraceae bacterium]
MKNLKKVFLKRCLPIMLSLSIMFSSMPMNVFAEEIVTDGAGTVTEHEHEHDEDGNCVIVEGEGEEGGEQPADTQPTPVPTVEPTDTEGAEGETGTEGDEQPADTQPTPAPVADPTESEGEPAEEPVEEPEEDVESAALKTVKQMIDDYMVKFNLTVGMSEDEITQAAYNAPSDPRPDFEAIAEYAEENLTEEDFDALVESYGDKLDIISEFYNTIELMNNPALIATTNVLGGVVTITNNKGTISSSNNNSYKITAKGGLFGRETVTLTIKNASKDTIDLIIEYSASNYNSLTISDASAAASGTYTKTLAPEASFNIVIAAKGSIGAGKATLNLSSITYKVAAAASDVTVNYDSTIGSVSSSAGVVTAGSTLTGITVTDGVALTATPNSGSTFVGWINAETGAILSTSASFTYLPTADATIKAVFAKNDGSDAWYGVGYTYDSDKVQVTNLYSSLNDALASSAGKYIVLMNSGKLPAGEYTIPAEWFLLIPYEANNIFSTSTAKLKGSVQNVDVNPYAYRSLTLESGAKLKIEGSMNVNAMIHAANGSRLGGGAPFDAYGYVKMAEGSSIEVANGGNLYVYGYINGAGKVNAASGASVYEVFQCEDFRGGSKTTAMAGGSWLTGTADESGYRVFPMNQYYVQNILSELTLNAGATEYAVAALTVSGMAVQTKVKFISNSNAMFNLTSGTVKKWYNSATDRLHIQGSGDIAIQGIDMSISSISINSKNYDLPINGNMTVEILEGKITLSQNVALLPGAEIIVGENADCTLNAGCSLFIFDADEWKGKGFTHPSGYDMLAAKYVPERTKTRTVADLVDAKVIVNGSITSTTGAIYTTKSGAAIVGGKDGVKVALTPVLEANKAKHYQLNQATPKYHSIEITSAQLLNEDGSYTDTASLGGAPVTFTYVDKDANNKTDGRWMYVAEDNDGVECGHAKLDYVSGTYATCEKAGEITYTCNHCLATVVEKPEAVGHAYDDGVITTDPGCEKTGVKTFTCQNVATGKVTTCEAPTYTEEVAATGHTSTDLAAVSPKCEEVGYTAGTVCSVCNTILSGHVEIPATGHDQNVVIDAVAATCETTGLTEGKKCSKCGEIQVAQTETPALGHKMGEWVVTDPTCTEDGSKTRICTNHGCNESETEVIATTGHKMGDWVVTQKATCVLEKIERQDCSVCDHFDTRTSPALGHDYDEGTVIEAETCTTNGIRQLKCKNVDNGLVTSTECSAYIKTETITAPGHKYDSVVTAPTCNDKGFTTYTCNNKFSDGNVCGDTYTDDEVAALGHKYEVTASEAPTCEENGYNTYTCSVCTEGTFGHTYTESVNSIGHDYGEWAYTEGKEPTCTAAGEESRVCANDPSHVETKTVAALGHNADKILEAVPATCTSTGLTAGTACSRCGEVQKAQEIVAKKSHAYNKVVTNPTCDDEGYTTYTCPDCGDTYTDDKVAALGHDYTSLVTTKPGCESEGVRTYTCKNDGKHTYTEPIPATGHNYDYNEDGITDEADKEFGWTTVTPAECEKDGSAERSCKNNCGDKETKTIPATGHNQDKVLPAVAATCEKVGYTEGKACSVCDKVQVEQVEIAKKEHNYTSEVTKKATCTENGQITYTCQNVKDGIV